MATVASSPRPTSATAFTRGLDERLLAWAPAVAVAIVVVQTVGHVVDWLVFDLRVTLLDADSDGCIYAWIATVSIFLAAIGFFVIDRFIRPVGFRRFLAPVLAFLSLDEMVAIHEHLGRVAVWAGYSEDAGRVIWPLVYLPLIGGVAILLWRFAAATAPKGGRFVRLSLVFLGAAVLMEMASTKLADGQHGRWAYQLEVIVEQNLELVGWALIGLAVVAAAVRLLERGNVASA
jgi:hypothetical protein